MREPSADTTTPGKRLVEFAKYERAYTKPNYRMGPRRRIQTVKDLSALPRGSYLDVSCGQGDMLDEAAKLGFEPCDGTEIISSLLLRPRVVYAEVHALPFPDASYDVVSMFDVIEHLVRPDDEAACRELKRVARKAVLLTANNGPKITPEGDNLHINIRSYKDWHIAFVEWFKPWRVTRLPGTGRASECWKIEAPKS